MFAILAYIQPIDLTTGERKDVRVASSPGPAYQGLGGQVWESAITSRPKATWEGFDIALAAGTRAGSVQFEVSLPAIQEVDDINALYWIGAPVTIYRADDLTWPPPIEFQGYVETPSRDIQTDRLVLNCAVFTKDIEVDLLWDEFDGSLGIGGGADKRGTPKPAGFGTCLNVAPVLVDAVRNIFMLDGYGNLLGVDWAADGLSSLGPTVADYPTFAALSAAIDAGTVPPGRWATSIADGVIGIGAPAGLLTCNAQFGYGTTGSFIRRVLLAHAKLDASRLVDASFDALDDAVPFPVHYWTSDQRQVKDLVEALAAAANASPIFTLQNHIAVPRIFGGSSIGSFVRYGFSDPAVTDWKTNDAVVPYWRICGRSARPGRVMAFSEINFSDTIVDRGLYDVTQVYRAGNVVWLRNKSQWLYINETAASGHAPPDPSAGDAWWENLAPPPDANDLRYLAGSPIESLQPAEAAAQISRTLTLSMTTFNVVIDETGTPVAGQFPYVGSSQVFAATTNVTAAATYAIATTIGISATINNTAGDTQLGYFQITGATQEGSITVTSVHGGVTMKQVITVTTSGTLKDLSLISTGLLEARAVTDLVSLATNTNTAGSGTAPSPTPSPVRLSYNLILPEDSLVLIFINGSLGYSAAADFSGDIVLDGTVVASQFAGSGAPAPGFSRQYGAVLSAGSHVVALAFRGSAGVTMYAGASLIIFIGKR